MMIRTQGFMKGEVPLEHLSDMGFQDLVKFVQDEASQENLARIFDILASSTRQVALEVRQLRPHCGQLQQSMPLYDETPLSAVSKDLLDMQRFLVAKLLERARKELLSSEAS